MRRNEEFNFEKAPVEYPEAERAMALISPDSIPFFSAAVGITLPLSDYRIHRSVRNRTNVFEYVIRGEGEILIDGVWQRVSAGDLYILRAGEEQNYRAGRDNPWEKIWLNYVADYVIPLMDGYGVKSGIYRGVDVRGHFEELLRLAESSEVRDDVYFIIADKVHEIIKAAAMGRLGEGGEDVYGLKRRLSTYVYERLDLEELARAVHMSRSNLIRVFKKNYSVTPYEYLLGLKIETAKLLLRETSLSSSEISRRLCISDEHYFSTLFFRRTGMRPSAYRKSKIK
jgi:AraC-like DNA-binding protein